MAYKDPKDQAAASKRHYEANKEKIIKRSRKRNIRQRDKNRIYVENIKKQSGCVDCGESNHLVLDFDHIEDNKYKCISNMVFESYSIKSIQKEIDKCEVRCSNCHRIITHNRRNNNSNLQEL
tara:strand:- start:723 stop:1088 length:366 start_codon:yes stop_codon:yes gene_type:complete